MRTSQEGLDFCELFSSQETDIILDMKKHNIKLLITFILYHRAVWNKAILRHICWIVKTPFVIQPVNRLLPYIEYQSVCPVVWIGSPSTPRKRDFSPHLAPTGGAKLDCGGWGVGTQFRLLDRRSGTLYSNPFTMQPLQNPPLCSSICVIFERRQSLVTKRPIGCSNHPIPIPPPPPTPEVEKVKESQKPQWGVSTFAKIKIYLKNLQIIYDEAYLWNP